MSEGLNSKRLSYQPLASTDVTAFEHLVTDEHVRRFLLDGQLVDHGWCRQEIYRSQALFRTHGVGLWLVFEGEANRAGPIGFCGFRVFEDMGPHPQLIYALLERATGQGYATEAAEAMIAWFEQRRPDPVIHAAADEPNAASLRVLEKVGFEVTGHVPGRFGRVVLVERSVGPT